MEKLPIKAVALLAVLGVLAIGLRRLGAAQSPTAAAPQDDPNTPSVIRFVKDPAPVPAFTARDVNGKTISSSDWHGKVVLVNFWATWCPPCRYEIPELIALQAKYPGALQIIGLSLDEGPEDAVKKFALQTGINYPVVIASEELQAKFGSVPALPTSFLINRNGGIVQKHVGVFPPTLFDTEVRALLGLAVEAKIETFEDTGQIFLTNAARATELPGVDLSKLSPEKKREALKQLNSQKCTCGCNLTLAQCRINDTTCPLSRDLANQIVLQVAGRTAPVAKPATQK